jgi:ferredoxin--NADP+ reductase
MVIDAPLVARRIQPGQFLILRVDEQGERIPLTMVDCDRENGTVTIVFQVLGKTTRHLNLLQEDDSILDLIGPLGNEMPLRKYGRVAVIGGGLGVVSVYPIAKGLKESGNEVLSIIGARSHDLLVMESEMRAASDSLSVTTDDGSYGRKGYVADELRDWLERGDHLDLVIAVGPAPMMRATAEVTRPYKLKTLVSLESTMVDGTGMCGACRVSAAGKTKFTCVDGPIFDAHELNFKELMARRKMYASQEKLSTELLLKKHSGGCRCHK